MTDLFDSFTESGALAQLLDSKDSKSCIREQLIKIGKSSRQIIPLHIYKLAANAIPNYWAKEKMYFFINKYPQHLVKACWKCIVGPLIVLTIFYGYFKFVLHQKDFNIYTFSVLAALKVLHAIPFIKNLKIRGHILYTFVTAVINGKKPHIAINDAIGNRNLFEIIYYPAENSYNNNSKFKKQNYASRQNYVTRQNGRQRNSNQRWRNRPQYIQCRNCGIQLENNYSVITEHNNNSCNPQ